MDKTGIFLLCIGVFAIGMLFGAVIQSGSDFKYETSAVMTCDYANNLTKIVNMQSETLKLYTGTDYTTLNYLNCSLITE